MATLVRWEPFREVAAMQNELSRLMNGLLEGNGKQTQAWVPALDVWETDDELVYAFDLPGIPQDKISVEAEDGALTVSAERLQEANALLGLSQNGSRILGPALGGTEPQTIEGTTS